MHVELTRLQDTGKQTIGSMEIYAAGGKLLYTCSTLELPFKNNQNNISCIPAGEYEVIERTTQTRGKHWQILNVPKRKWILIHPGNYAGSINPKTGHSDIQGCILPGTAFADINKDGIKDIINSTVAMNKLREILPANFKINIHYLKMPVTEKL